MRVLVVVTTIIALCVVAIIPPAANFFALLIGMFLVMKLDSIDRQLKQIAGYPGTHTGRD